MPRPVVESEKSRPIPNAKKAREMLIEGNKQFVDDWKDDHVIDRNVREARAGGQDPYAVIVCCSDSRVTPEWIFAAGLSDLFVIRVAGNVAAEEAIASVEYAVGVLGVKLVVVLGHEGCGAVKEALKRTELTYHVSRLLSHMLPVLTKTSPEDADDAKKVAKAVKNNAKVAAEALVTASPKVIGKKGVEVVPAYYHLGSGKVEYL